MPAHFGGAVVKKQSSSLIWARIINRFAGMQAHQYHLAQAPSAESFKGVREQTRWIFIHTYFLLVHPLSAVYDLHATFNLIDNMTSFFKCILLSIALSACAYAQSIEIGSPSNGTTQTLGQSIDLELDFPVSGAPHRSQS